VIGKADEYLVHQTELPLAQVVSQHPEWQDRFYFNIHDTEGKFAAMTGLGVFPNRKAGPHGMVQAYLFAVHNGRHYSYLNVRPIDADRERMVAGSLEYSIVEPLEAWRLDVADEANGVRGELTFRARCPLYTFSPIRWQDGENLVADQLHYTQSGRYEGTFSIGGETFSGLVGMRDRSWGVRDMRRVPVWHWISAQFADFCVSAWLWETPAGEVIHCDGAIVPESGPARPVTAIEHGLELRPGAKRFRAARYTLTLADGEKVALEAEEIGSIILGPAPAAWSEDDADTLAAADTAAFGFDEHCRFRMAGQTGYGIVEFMVTGGSRRYGIAPATFGG
jgi:hypothetical protein